LASAGVTPWPHNRLMHTHPIDAKVPGALVVIVAIHRRMHTQPIDARVHSARVPIIAIAGVLTGAISRLTIAALPASSVLCTDVKIKTHCFDFWGVAGCFDAHAYVAVITEANKAI